MKPATVLAAVLTAVLATAISWVLLDTWAGSGGTPPPLPASAVIGTAALVLVVIAAGLPVRRWLHGRRDRALDPLVAARTAVLAKAAAYGGAALTGWYLAQSVIILPDLVGSRRNRFIIGLIAAVFAVLLSVAGFVVQHWCRTPPQDDDQDGQAPDRHSVG